MQIYSQRKREKRLYKNYIYWIRQRIKHYNLICCFLIIFELISLIPRRKYKNGGI